MRWTPADSAWMKRLYGFVRNEEPIEPENVGF